MLLTTNIKKLNNTKGMKTIIILLFSILAIELCAQNDPLPTDIQTGLNKKYPQRDSIKWEKDVNTYDITCFSKGEHFIAVFTLFGDWRETKFPLSIEKVPAPIVKAVEEKHKEVEYYDIYRVETSDGREMFELKTDTETAGYLIRAYADGKINLSKKLFIFED